MILVVIICRTNGCTRERFGKKINCSLAVLGEYYINQILPTIHNYSGDQNFEASELTTINGLPTFHSVTVPCQYFAFDRGQLNLLIKSYQNWLLPKCPSYRGSTMLYVHYSRLITTLILIFNFS